MAEVNHTRRPFKKVSDDHKWFVGICGGLAYAFGVPVLLVRVGFILLMLCTNPYLHYIGGLIFSAYILFWIFAPRWDEDPEDYEERTS